MDRKLVILSWAVILLSLTKIVRAGDIDSVRNRVSAWSQAWQNRNLENYMSFYSPDFRSQGLDYATWKAKKGQIFNNCKRIKIELSDLWVFVEGPYARATFIQRYHDQDVLDVGEKTLVLKKSDGTWKIISEEWKPLATPVQPDRSKSAAPPEAEAATGIRNIFHQSRNPAGKSPATDQTIVKNIKLQINKASDKVCLALNHYAIPEVLTLAGDRPRIVIDIMNVPFWEGQLRYAVEGKLVRQIRTYLHRDLGKLRIVLDLHPAEDYLIDQLYDRAKDIYCIEVSYLARQNDH